MSLYVKCLKWFGADCQSDGLCSLCYVLCLMFMMLTVNIVQWRQHNCDWLRSGVMCESAEVRETVLRASCVSEEDVALCSLLSPSGQGCKLQLVKITDGFLILLSPWKKKSISLPLSLISFTAAGVAHRLHGKHGKNVVLLGEGCQAVRVGGYAHGIVFSAKELKADELFEVNRRQISHLLLSFDNMRYFLQDADLVALFNASNRW